MFLIFLLNSYSPNFSHAPFDLTYVEQNVIFHSVHLCNLTLFCLLQALITLLIVLAVNCNHQYLQDRVVTFIYLALYL